VQGDVVWAKVNAVGNGHFIISNVFQAFWEVGFKQRQKFIIEPLLALVFVVIRRMWPGVCIMGSI